MWKILRDRNIKPPYLPLWNLYVCQEATVELNMEQQTGSKSGKEYVKSAYFLPAYLQYMQSTSCELPGWMKHRLESRLPGEIPITPDTQMTSPLWQKVKKNQRGSWWKWKRRVKKLKLNIQKAKIVAFDPITSLQIDGETMETVRDFILGGSKITADGDYSHEVKGLLLLRRKVMTNLDSILKKQKHYFANKGPYI